MTLHKILIDLFIVALYNHCPNKCRSDCIYCGSDLPVAWHQSKAMLWVYVSWLLLVPIESIASCSLLVQYAGTKHKRLSNKFAIKQDTTKKTQQSLLCLFGAMWFFFAQFIIQPRRWRIMYENSAKFNQSCDIKAVQHFPLKCREVVG